VQALLLLQMRVIISQTSIINGYKACQQDFNWHKAWHRASFIPFATWQKLLT